MITPPTKQCPECGGTRNILGSRDGETVALSCPTCHGTGVVTAEAENMADRLQRDSSRDKLAEEIIKHEPDVEKIKQITGLAPTPPAATDDEVMAILTRVSEGAWSLGLQGAGREALSNSRQNSMTPAEAHAALDAHYAAKLKRALRPYVPKIKDGILGRYYGKQAQQAQEGK